VTEAELPPLFMIGDRVEWGTRDAKCQCFGHNGKHKPSLVKVVSIPVARPGGKILYAVDDGGDGLGFADARYLRKVTS
jgi:hypothetical protein